MFGRIARREAAFLGKRGPGHVIHGAGAAKGRGGRLGARQDVQSLFIGVPRLATIRTIDAALENPMAGKPARRQRSPAARAPMAKKPRGAAPHDAPKPPEPPRPSNTGQKAAKSGQIRPKPPKPAETGLAARPAKPPKPPKSRRETPENA